MKIAIVGSGFSGCGVCWHLLLQKGVEITLFSAGGGATHIASGLLHPYPGMKARRSWKASEGMRATKNLLKTSEEVLGRSVAIQNGIIRHAMMPDSVEIFLKRAAEYDDFEMIGPKLAYIRSGMTVHARSYLEGLLGACLSRGARYVERSIGSLEELEGFDTVILACGAGMTSLAPELKLNSVKGQILKCRMAKKVERSIIGKGYLALGEEPGTCFFGATYERNFIDNEADEKRVKALLFPNLEMFLPSLSEFNVLECYSGIRISSQISHLPLIGKLQDGIWVMTGMKSRGLLYHALLGEQLAHAVMLNDESVIDREVRLS